MKVIPKEDLIILLQGEEGNMVNLGDIHFLFEECGDDYEWDEGRDAYVETHHNTFRKVKLALIIHNRRKEESDEREPVEV